MKSVSQLKLQEELERVLDSPFMNRTDAQIDGQIKLSEIYRDRYQGVQPSSLEKFNDPQYRKCKLTMDQAIEIRQKYLQRIQTENIQFIARRILQMIW